MVVGNAPADFLQSTDVFRTKNENIKELEANKMAASKMAKAKAPDTSSSGVKVAGDMKSIQINNKLNNNAMIEAQHDDVHASDKIDLKTLKAKNAVGPAAPTVTSAAAMGIPKPAFMDTKVAQKPNSGSNNNSSDVANKSNNNIATNNATAAAVAAAAAAVAAAKTPAKEGTKKKSKEKDQKAAEEKRRQAEEEEERKRLELIAAQRKAKLVDQNAVRAEQGPKRNNLAASVGECWCSCVVWSPKFNITLNFTCYSIYSTMVEFGRKCCIDYSKFVINIDRNPES